MTTRATSPAPSRARPSADETSAVGAYPITCAGATSANYTITYVAGTLSVTPATLIAHPTVDNKAFDGNTTANVSGGTVEGVLNGDSVSLDVSGALANFDTPAAGTNKPVHVTGTRAQRNRCDQLRAGLHGG